MSFLRVKSSQPASGHKLIKLFGVLLWHSFLDHIYTPFLRSDFDMDQAVHIPVEVLVRSRLLIEWDNWTSGTDEDVKKTITELVHVMFPMCEDLVLDEAL